MQKKLFVIYIGGSHEKSFIELHDMRFVAAPTIEDTYDELKKSWWGVPDSLHLDAWGVLEHADGYDIHLKNEPSNNNGESLFFVNLGGYNPNEFTELHKNVFVVAKDSSEAKIKALKLVTNWESPHRDYHFDVEEAMNVSSMLGKDGVYIHLAKNEAATPFEFICRYVPIGRI